MSRRQLKVLAAFLLIVVSSWAQGPNNTGTYYEDADGKMGKDLKTAMFCIISENTRALSYDDLWRAFKVTDAREDGKVWDMYSGITNYRFGTDQAGNVKEEGTNYNREHSFPKSWFDKGKPMYTDLFHLYPVDSWVNSCRSNLPFGEVDTDKKYKGSKNMFSKWGYSKSKGYSEKVFEPNDEYKGDFARTYFYMATRYESMISNWHSPMLNHDRYNAYKPWAMEMLLRWAEQDPVSKKETDRNDAVYKEQGNRNPFIDYPGLEQYIWGDKKDKSFSYDNYDSEDTGIFDVEADSEDNSITYDLNGRIVKDNYKGIVIKKGKKVLVN